MSNLIKYGPHLFPGGPELYIRTSTGIRVSEAHLNIKQSLAYAFDRRFSDSIICQISGQMNLDSDAEVGLSFMNYGDMQLVYLATLGKKSKLAVLINQPHTPIGKVRQEYDNLQGLVNIDPRFVIKPLAYLALRSEGHDLYASEYIENAICVGVHPIGLRHGFFDPLPEYHFESFQPEISSAANSGMIGLLVNYYDSEMGRGLSKVRTSGDDFMFTRNFNKQNPATVKPTMKIIAARDFVYESFDEYLDRLRQEFLIATNSEDPSVVSGQIRVNVNSKLPMTEGEIEEGIELGSMLRGQRRWPSSL